MTYRVEVTAQAEMDALDAYEWLYEQEPSAADRWYKGLRQTLASLSDFPERHARAPESAEFEENIRLMTYGKRSGVYRILYTIEEDTVFILSIRHGRRLRLDEEAEL